MGINWSEIAAAGGIPKGPSRFETKAAKQAAIEQHERQVYALVTKRDESCCRVCGLWRNPRAFSLLAKLHRHHLVYRSQGGPTETWNVVGLCAKHHDEEHAGKLRLSGDADLRDADGRLCGVKVERPTPEGWEVVAWT